jgi:DNA-binding NtrC family response regulator
MGSDGQSPQVLERVLIVDDDASMCQFLSILLAKEGYEVVTTSSGREALDRVREQAVDVVITDIKMPEMDGIAVLEGMKRIDPALPVVIMTAFASQRTAIDALNKGAFQYLEKHARNDEIKLVVRNALAMKRVQRENLYLKRQLKKSHHQKEIIGTSEEMRRVFRMVSKVAETDSTVLISGESGTGKELIACEIHYQSRRTNGPFVSINCGALPKDLLESNLFGHIKGSFTGAVRDQAGLLAVAEGGTFFLDEVGEMQPATQVKLLRALQEREIIPVGGTKPIKIDVRLIAATNADLEKEVTEGRFRADLYYRLNVIPLPLPALRQRRSDIPLLVDYFLKKFAGDGPPKTITRDTLQLLERYAWPGNVRELENIIERAVILDENGVIDPDDVPEPLHSQVAAPREAILDETPTLTLEQLEEQYIMKVLRHTGWQKKRASEILGINASTLYRKLVSYGMIRDGRPEVVSEAA